MFLDHRFPVRKGLQGFFSAPFRTTSSVSITGYISVMAGGSGVLLFGAYKLPDPIGKSETLAFHGKSILIYAGYVQAATVAGHPFIVLRHQLFMRDGLFYRMLMSRRK